MRNYLDKREALTKNGIINSGPRRAGGTSDRFLGSTSSQEVRNPPICHCDRSEAVRPRSTDPELIDRSHVLKAISYLDGCS